MTQGNGGRGSASFIPRRRPTWHGIIVRNNWNKEPWCCQGHVSSASLSSLVTAASAMTTGLNTESSLFVLPELFCHPRELVHIPLFRRFWPPFFRSPRQHWPSLPCRFGWLSSASLIWSFGLAVGKHRGFVTENMCEGNYVMRFCFRFTYWRWCSSCM